MLKGNYVNREKGRIQLSQNSKELWSHHKYSVLARDLNRYKEIGRNVSRNKVGFEDLFMELIKLLRIPPKEGGIRNALHKCGVIFRKYQTAIAMAILSHGH